MKALTCLTLLFILLCVTEKNMQSFSLLSHDANTLLKPIHQAACVAAQVGPRCRLGFSAGRMALLRASQSFPSLRCSIIYHTHLKSSLRNHKFIVIHYRAISKGFNSPSVTCIISAAINYYF